MALNFPSSPTTGNQFKSPQGLTWQWDGAKWTAIGIVSNLVTQSQVFITAEVLPGTISMASTDAVVASAPPAPPTMSLASIPPPSVGREAPLGAPGWVGQ